MKSQIKAVGIIGDSFHLFLYEKNVEREREKLSSRKMYRIKNVPPQE